jgi:co-chaperonin GroES (HSP10)
VVAAESDRLKHAIIDKVGDLSGFEIAQNELLVAIYMREEKTPGGIVLPHQNLKEDLYQAKAHLVLKIGSACRFVRTDERTGVKFGIPVNVFDWVVLRPSDAWALDINMRPSVLDRRDFVPCRMIYDDMIRAKISHPSMVW